MQLAAIQRAKEMKTASLQSLDASRQAILSSGLPILDTPLAGTPGKQFLGGGAHSTSSPASTVTQSPQAPRPLDPIEHSKFLLARSNATHEEARHVEAIRDALWTRVDVETTDVMKLREQLDAASKELKTTHSELASKQKEVQTLRAQLDHMVEVTSELLKTIDPATAGALSIAISALKVEDGKGTSAAGTGALQRDPLRLSALTPSTPLEVRQAASYPEHVSFGVLGQKQRPVDDNFQAVLAKFDSWARDHDAAVTMIQAIHGTDGQR
jgi:hypothetical protein